MDEVIKRADILNLSDLKATQEYVIGIGVIAVLVSISLAITLNMLLFSLHLYFVQFYLSVGWLYPVFAIF